MTRSPAPALIYPALVVALGVTVSAWPLGDLFEERSWQWPLLLTTSAVALTGILARRVDRLLAVAAQGVVALLALAALFGEDTTWFGLPTADTAHLAVELYRDAVHVISSYSVPAPATVGVAFVLTAGFTLVAWLADIAGVTYQRPLLAAVPLLVPFLTAVANVGEPLPWPHVTAVVVVVGLLLHDGHRRAVDAWLGTGTQPGRGARGITAGALAAAAVVIALVAAASLPHMQTRYLADGLGRGPGGAQVGFTPSPDLITDLSNDDDTPVLRYTTDDAVPPPIKVSVARTLQDGRWIHVVPDAAPSSSPSFPPPAGLGADTPRERRVIDVVETRLEPPFLAAPGPVIDGAVAGAQWAVAPLDQVVVVDERPQSYSMGYLTLPEARGGDRLSEIDGLLAAGVVDPGDLDTSASTPLLRETLAEVTATATTPAERADAISRWLRGDPSFTYSLTIPYADGEGAAAVDAFLTERVGYCVQFATVMVLMAREEGIPARMATGFLPGVPDGTERVVRSRDAHAWPELYLEGLGWVRYEATPSVRAGIAPLYGPVPEAAPGADPEPEEVDVLPEGGATTGPDRGLDPGLDAEETTPGTATGSDEGPGVATFSVVAGVVLLLLALLAAAALLTPLARHRYRLATADSPDDEVVEHWRHLEARLTDLGLETSPAATIRTRAADYLADLTTGDPELEEAFARLVAVYEKARYSRSAVDQEEVASCRRDVETVLARARRDADLGTRWRAVVTPADGVLAGVGRP